MSQEVNLPALPETQTFRPAGSGVKREDGEVLLQFLVPPAKVVIIALPEGEAEQTLLAQLTGGITIARDLPQGLGG